ncbi:MAG: hypothetical protein BRD55_01720 [Bacteroidetes bacterium SW_9_63_38]|nr:MAG: hypothetical protein BRD55_01720 [Bacteroidetes bacterium SW_9_63_38]
MSLAYLVASILAIGWNVAIVALIVLSRTDPFGSDSDSGRAARHCVRRVQAEVGTLEFDARSGRSGRRDDGTVATNEVRRHVEETSCEVEVDVPYVEASVPVTTNEGDQQRRCSVCMN